MIVAELPFVEIERELRRADAMVLEQLALGVRPEPFEPIDVHLAAAEPPPVIDAQMPIATERQRVIAVPLVAVDQAAPLDPAERVIANGARAAVGHHLHPHVATALEDTEDRPLVRRAPPRVARAMATAPRTARAEVALIGFDLALPEGRPRHFRRQDRAAHGRERLERRGIAHARLHGGLTGGQFELEELHEPEPRSRAHAHLAGPGAGPHSEGVATAATPRAPFG